MFKRQLTSLSHAVIGLSGLLITALLPVSAFGQSYNVEINKSQILQIPTPAAAVVVGNPAIADVSVHSPTMLFIVGRGYGVTNVIILDELGQTIMNADIQVGNNNSNSGTRVLMAGQGWRTYDCNPFCQPAPVLGDEPAFVADFKGQEQMIDNTNTPITTTTFSGQPATPGVLSTALPQMPMPTAMNPEPLVPNMQQVGTSMPGGAGRGRSAY